jgi:hypothetical protein
MVPQQLKNSSNPSHANRLRIPCAFVVGVG